jgi:hypothetical protein
VFTASGMVNELFNLRKVPKNIQIGLDHQGHFISSIRLFHYGYMIKQVRLMKFILVKNNLIPLKHILIHC